MPTSRPITTSAATFSVVKLGPWTWRLLFVFALLSCALALPTTITPVDDGSIVLNVGQHTRISKQNWTLGVVFILLGLVEVFYGFKFIRLTLFVTGFLAWAIAAMMIMIAIRWDLVYATFQPQYYFFWVWLIAGITGAVLSFRYWDLGVTFTGAFGGFALAMGIVAVANLSISNAGRYVIIGVLILGGAALATFFERVFIVFSTSFGGAYLFMFGVDQFAQVGYREMLVIFDFTGKTLTYHPNMEVYMMLGFSLILAALGVAWEFWHHEKPLLVERKALFRIYGRPFGKRPKKLVGQRIHHHLKTRSDVYMYILGCFCLQRWSVDDVLYEDDNCSEVGHSVPDQSAISEEHSPPSTPLATTPSRPEDHITKEPKATVPTTEYSDPLLKAVPFEGGEAQKQIHTSDPPIHSSTSITSVIHERYSGINKTEKEETQPAAYKTITSSHTERIDNMEITFEESYSPDQATDTEENIATLPLPPPQRLEPHHHTLFSSHLGERTMQMLQLVAEDTSPGNTIPREFLSSHFGPARLGSLASLSRTTTSYSDADSSTGLIGTRGLHMLEISESTQGSHESQGSETSTDLEQGRAPEFGPRGESLH
ncbi:hypothetical protein EDD11_001135 [Mortierella claussenii]|nr:hypothetical protein EDD11_001135 [Mortierella claussenii]